MPSDYEKVHQNVELTDTEKEQLLQVMKKAKEFEQEEEKNLLRQRLEGQLLKFTNVVKGFQYRWFALDPDLGVLEYFEKEDHKKLQRSRGFLPLACAVISPSDEDSQTFNVNAVNGEVYKLKAFDAKERQHWVNRLRAVSEFHTENYVNQANVSVTNYLSGQDTPDSGQRTPERPRRKLTSSATVLGTSSNFEAHISSSDHQGVDAKSSNKCDPLQRSARDILSDLHHQQADLFDLIEKLPSSSVFPSPLDRDILILKATSQSTVICLEQCLEIIKDYSSIMNGYTLTSNPSLHTHQRCGSDPLLEGNYTINADESKNHKRPSSPQRRGSSISCHSRVDLVPTSNQSASMSQSTALQGHVNISSSAAQLCPIVGMEVMPAPAINHFNDQVDAAVSEEEDLGSVEDHKSVILHLLSQLKLGMDLTRVVLPTFILEKRSLLEMFADCMAHPQLFLRISDQTDPESRILGVLEWYLTSFHAGRKGSLAKKPYNPLIGETFHCSWPLNECGVKVGENGDANGRLVYTAEQVSHHPPVTAFYFECPEKNISLNASIYTKSKFMGMSIGVSMLGNLRLNLVSHGEEYIFSLPSAYARSILTVPWVELGDKISLTCAQSQYSAFVTFHTKPFYGGKLHRVTAEVKNQHGIVCSKVQGEWNGILEFENSRNEKRLVDVNNLPQIRKHVRPLLQQQPFESRRLWQSVTEALIANDIRAATEQKHMLEERQRQSEKFRRERALQFPVKYFQRQQHLAASYSELDKDAATTPEAGWIFIRPLQSKQAAHVST